MNILVPIYVESRYKVSRKKIKETVIKTLETHGVKGSAEVSVAVVGDRKMKELNKKYRNLDKTTNVLSFSQTEGEERPIPSDILILGDVVVSYPRVIMEAAEESVLVDDKINELVEHGVMHLLGIHHEE